MSLSDDEYLDLAAGIGDDGALIADQAVRAAREALVATRRFVASDIKPIVDQRLKEVLRDETGRIRGCSSTGCVRPAVWQRVFKKSPNPQRMLADMAMAASVFVHVGVGHSGMGVFGQPADFGGYRLGEARSGDILAAFQFGCWRHLADFVSIPSIGGRYYYEIMSATLPDVQPHPVFGIDEELWKSLKTAADAQSLGEPEGPRGFCSKCGLPHCPFSTRGLKFGEGDDFWRAYCAYCGAEVKVEAEGEV